MGSETHDDYWTTGRYLATAVVIPMLLIASVFGAFTVEHPSQGFRQGAGRGRTVEYTLHTSCISAETRAAMPAFFRPGASVTGASIVRHDPSRPGLGLEEGVTMRSAPQPTTHSEPGRFVATAEVDGDWGFALRNSFGETFYEMGSGEDAPMWGKSCPDARTFRRGWAVVRTLAPRLKAAGAGGGERSGRQLCVRVMRQTCDEAGGRARPAGPHRRGDGDTRGKSPGKEPRRGKTHAVPPVPLPRGGSLREGGGSAATRAAKSAPKTTSKTSAPSARASAK